MTVHFRGSYQTDLEKLRAGELRKVSAKRARKLRKAGHSVWWSSELSAYVWKGR